MEMQLDKSNKRSYNKIIATLGYISQSNTSRLVHFPLTDPVLGGDGYMTFEIGSTAYIVESNRLIREVTIVKRNGDFYIIRFGTRGGIQVRSNRIFASYEDADSSIHKKTEKRTEYRSPYDYIH